MGGSVEVGIAIGLHPCGNNPCSQMPAISIEPLLYVGPYNPQYHEIGLQPYQNFTVTVPEYTLPGPPQEVSLNVAHFELVSVRPDQQHTLHRLIRIFGIYRRNGNPLSRLGM